MDERVLTEHGVFLTTDAQGEIPIGSPGALGLYYQDTRFVSGLALRVNGASVPLLGIEDHGYAAVLTYAAVAEAHLQMEGEASHILMQRTRYISAGEPATDLSASTPALCERVALTSYNREPLEVTLDLSLTADFRDIFVVRHFMESEPGVYDPPAIDTPGRIVLSYTGRDGARRRTGCYLAPAPAEVSVLAAGEHALAGIGAAARYRLVLQPRQPTIIDITFIVAIETMHGHDDGPRAEVTHDFEHGLAALAESHSAWIETACTAIETDNEALNGVVRQSLRDLRLLLLTLSTGPYVVAGIPWFAVPFGRDGLIVALQLLMVNPSLATGTLRYLAGRQGRRLDPARDEEPGKIMHEMRAGELVQCGLAPFGPYYGSVDATPLFLVLLGRALEWLDDMALLRDLEPAFRAALAWLDGHGDPDGDGYVEFERKAGRGIANQGWKDSGDSLQFPGGRYAEAPVALVEVQGYTYEARRAAAGLLRRLGDDEAAAAQDRKAAALRARFNEGFWLEREACYAQALDARKQQVPAVTSNTGHPLWSGIADAGKAAQVARRLLAEDMFSGWGIRTLSTDYPSYDPLSYHNGSVWPHDTAIVAAGLKRYGHDAAAAHLLAAVVDAAGGYQDRRLPELYGGLARHTLQRGPIPYPVSCSPQAWAAASVFMMLQSALGLEPDAAGGTIRLKPFFPAGVNRVSLRRLRVGQTAIDLEIERCDGDTFAVRHTSLAGTVRTWTLAPGQTAILPLAADPQAG